jgi:hypothetical protein
MRLRGSWGRKTPLCWPVLALAELFEGYPQSLMGEVNCLPNPAKITGLHEKVDTRGYSRLNTIQPNLRRFSGSGFARKYFHVLKPHDLCGSGDLGVGRPPARTFSPSSTCETCKPIMAENVHLRRRFPADFLSNLASGDVVGMWEITASAMMITSSSFGLGGDRRQHAECTQQRLGPFWLRWGPSELQRGLGCWNTWARWQAPRRPAPGEFLP